METQRIKKEEGKDVPFWKIVYKNKMTMYFCIHFTMLFSIYYFLGWESIKYQLCYNCWGVLFLESINYIEHYGLLRRQDENGIYESISKMHSWNSKSGPVLIRLQRHSDHHAHAHRPYQILRRFDEAPFLPFDYLHSVLLCQCPPLWFYLMNPKVEAVRDLAEGKKGNKTQYNLYMPETADDKKRKIVGWAALAAFQVFLTYFTFIAY
jgi:alkane 1-monooxygenase